MTILGPYAALDHTFLVDVVNGDDPALAALLAPMASEGATAAHTYRVALPEGEDVPGWIEVDGRPVTKAEPAAIHTLLVLELGQAALEDLREPVLHGCLVEHRGVGILVAGHSGSGKSTLTARLLADGAGLVTEDLTALRPDGSVRPYPRPVGLSATAFELLDLPLPEDDCGCGCMKYALHPETLGGRVASEGRIDVVVLCDKAGTGTTELTLPGLLARLFDEASIGNVDDPTQLALVARTLAGARLVQQGTEDLEAAAAAIDGLLASAGPPVTVAAEQLGDASVLYLDGEALIHVGEQVHHLDAAATAVWVLHTEGLSDEQVAAELGADVDVVVATLARLHELELPAPTP
jgi:hypothetical protein